MKLDQLPEELYQAILESIDDLKQRALCTLALSRCLPRSPVPQRWLYDHITVTNAQSLLSLYQNLNSKRAGKSSSTEAGWIRIIELQSFTLDGQIAANLLGLLPDIQELLLNVGTTYSPEHLDEIFQIPRLRLVSLRVVFRPYVQKATYYTFLKGAYFDSCLERLAAWPADSRLSNISIIQEPPPSSLAFAQPIVFFSLEPLARLSRSSALHNVSDLSVRIPGRDISVHLCTTMTTHPDSTPNSLNKVQRLDLSTTQISPKSLGKLLIRFKHLQYLILDDSGLARNAENLGEFVELGKLCALANLRKAQEREKLLREVAKARREAKEAQVAKESGTVSTSLEELSATSSNAPRAPKGPAPPPTSSSKSKRGRRSVAMSTFSIREKPAPPVVVQQPVTTEGIPPATLEKIRIFPMVISLQSLCITTFPPPDELWIRERKNDFARGWMEGITQLENVQNRLLKSKKDKLIRLCRFRNEDENKLDEQFLEARLQAMQINAISQPELEGLEEMSEYEEFLVGVKRPPPKLCFGGGDPEGIHAIDCAHHIRLI